MASQKKIIVTRPLADSTLLAGTLRDRGYEVVLAPLIEINARADVIIPPLPYQAVCLTSANAARHLPSSVARSLSVFTLGAQSAAAAFGAGFNHVEAKGGNVDGLAANIIACLKPERGPILYISGNETSGDVAATLRDARFNVTKVITYDAVPQVLLMSESEIRDCDVVLLYSTRTAKIWVSEMQRLMLFPRLTHICLSKQIMEVLPETWRRRAAAAPTEVSLLELIDLVAKKA